MQKKCALICGGTFTRSHIQREFSEYQDTYLVSVDSGANLLHELNVVPNVAIGDFDSISLSSKEWLNKNKVKIISHPADKDKTDLELALEYLNEHQFQSGSIYAALGGRIDHLLGNILLLTNPAFQLLNITIHDLGTTIYRITPNNPLTILGSQADTFSIIPLSIKLLGVTISGTKWELINDQIEMGSTKAVSNEFLSNSVSVSIKEGIGLVIHLSKDNPYTS